MKWIIEQQSLDQIIASWVKEQWMHKYISIAHCTWHMIAEQYTMCNYTWLHISIAQCITHNAHCTMYIANDGNINDPLKYKLSCALCRTSYPDIAPYSNIKPWHERKWKTVVRISLQDCIARKCPSILHWVTWSRWKTTHTLQRKVASLECGGLWCWWTHVTHMLH